MRSESGAAGKARAARRAPHARPALRGRACAGGVWCRQAPRRASQRRGLDGGGAPRVHAAPRPRQAAVYARMSAASVCNTCMPASVFAPATRGIRQLLLFILLPPETFALPLPRPPTHMLPATAACSSSQEDTHAKTPTLSCLRVCQARYRTRARDVSAQTTQTRTLEFVWKRHSAFQCTGTCAGTCALSHHQADALRACAC